MIPLEKYESSWFQWLPLFKGKLRLSRFFYRNKANLASPRIISARKGFQFKVPSLIDSIGYELFINGIYETKLVNYLISAIPQNGVLIDVGANIGAISILVAKRRSDIKVHAFEASPFIFSFLKVNKELNKLDNLYIYNNAVHNTDGAHMNFYAPQDQFGKGSFSQTYTNKAESVTTISLDTFLLQNDIKPDIIKVDVQGYEINVFKGMQSFLQSTSKKPEIIFEFEDWAESIAIGKENITAAQQYLLALGYSIYEFDKPKMSKISHPITIGSRELIARFLP
ncbi:MAG: FkbM family methyltransferase [Bacteroidetes bacterium]|nr:FkbM family methyltransferase [Bacteroidota bacterium]